MRRVARRMAIRNAKNLKQYLQIVQKDQSEAAALFDELLILVSSFFRDPGTFEALEKTILPRILEDKQPGDPVRVWVAGCSTGEEPYSIGMSLLDFLGDQRSTHPVSVFATDLSHHALHKARTGRYTEPDLSVISRQRLDRYFERTDGQFRVKDALRELYVFARHDMLRDPPFSRIDLISCRNVLIYFDGALQQGVIERFHYSLKEGGHLVLGRSESLSSSLNLFHVVDRKSKIFRKNPSVQPRIRVPKPSSERTLPERRSKERIPDTELERQLDLTVWDRCGLAGLLVDNDLHILHFRGDTSTYLRPTPGKATFHLTSLLREDLMVEARDCIQKARQSGHATRKERIRIKDEGRERLANIEVRPLQERSGEQHYLLLFEKEPLAGKASAKRSPVSKADEQEIVRLERELESTRAYVQSVIRNQETANEELKAANEEAYSSMEELQSTNEELETAKEELQSSNEELVTLNEQLQNSNVELARATDDLTNILDTVDLAVLLLDGDLRIRLFTPPAERLLGLIPGDVGRPGSCPGDRSSAFR